MKRSPHWRGATSTRAPSRARYVARSSSLAGFTQLRARTRQEKMACHVIGWRQQIPALHLVRETMQGCHPRRALRSLERGPVGWRWLVTALDGDNKYRCGLTYVDRHWLISHQLAAHAGSSREVVLFRFHDPSTRDSRTQGPPQRTKTSQRNVGWGQQIPGSSQLCRATPAPHAVPRRQDSRTKWLQDDIGRVASLKRLAANLVESSRLGSRHRHSCPSCRWHKGFGCTGQGSVALLLNGRSSRRPLLDVTMENFRIRSRRSLVWWGRAPQTCSMREGFGIVPLARTLASWR